MSKLKTNDKVIIKATGKSGIIKGRDVVNLRDDKVKIEYIVKTDEGFENWGTFSKDELEKVTSKHKEKLLEMIGNVEKYASTLEDKDGFYNQINKLKNYIEEEF